MNEDRTSPAKTAATSKSIQQNHKRKNLDPPSTLFDRLFKRSRTDKHASANTNKSNTMTESKSKSAGEAKAKPTLEKSRKKEIKSRLNAEAGREIRPLAVGTVAMMASALANQGEFIYARIF
jgi:hypothetical protein